MIALLTRYLIPISLVLAVLIWTSLFRTQWLPIPVLLPLAALTLGTAGWVGNPRQFRNEWSFARLILTATFTAALFYGVCLAGWTIVKFVIPAAVWKVELIYSLRSALSPAPLGLILLLSVAAAEEIFWRGFIQSTLANRIGRYRAVPATALLYAGIHIGADNPMLFTAAFVGGLFWGWLYLRSNNIFLTILNHVIWTISVFYLFPFDLLETSRYV